MERLGVTGEKSMSDDELIAIGIKHKEIRKYVEAELNNCARAAAFNSLEKVKSHFEIVANEFKVGEILTPTMKLQRKKAREFFQKEIQAIYEKSDAIINM